MWLFARRQRSRATSPLSEPWDDSSCRITAELKKTDRRSIENAGARLAGLTSDPASDRSTQDNVFGPTAERGSRALREGLIERRMQLAVYFGALAGR